MKRFVANLFDVCLGPDKKLMDVILFLIMSVSKLKDSYLLEFRSRIKITSFMEALKKGFSKVVHIDLLE